MFIAALLLIFMLLPFAVTTPVAAQANLACEGLTEVTGDSDCDGNSGDITISGTITVLLNLLSIIAGVIAVIMIIIAGIKYITSQGDPSSVGSARSAIIYALIGLIIVALSQIIIFFVIDFFTSPPASTNEAGCTVVQIEAGTCSEEDA